MLARFGRALHWIGVFTAICILGFGVYAGSLAVGNNIVGAYGPSAETFAAGAVLVSGLTIFVYFVGRALRYFLSGE